MHEQGALPLAWHLALLFLLCRIVIFAWLRQANSISFPLLAEPQIPAARDMEHSFGISDAVLILCFLPVFGTSVLATFVPGLYRAVSRTATHETCLAISQKFSFLTGSDSYILLKYLYMSIFVASLFFCFQKCRFPTSVKKYCNIGKSNIRKEVLGCLTTISLWTILIRKTLFLS